MRANYDFSKARRGAVVPAVGNKLRITIRFDKDIVEWFKSRVEAASGGNYQTLLNDALRQHIAHQEEPLEKVLRRVVREELHGQDKNPIESASPDKSAESVEAGRKSFPERNVQQARCWRMTHVGDSTGC